MTLVLRKTAYTRKQINHITRGSQILSNKQLTFEDTQEDRRVPRLEHFEWVPFILFELISELLRTVVLRGLQRNVGGASPSRRETSPDS